VERGDALVVVDVRQMHEWKLGHLPGAQLIEAGDVADADPGLPRDRLLAAHCEHGQRAATALSILERRGYERVVEQLPGGAHYHALEVCARTRLTTQELLNHVLGRDEAASAFEWLRGLSFIEHTPDGVVPHDLAREILDADLRWRDPEGYRDLHGRILRYLVGRLQTRTGREQQRAYFDFVYLSRTSPVMRSYYDWETMTAAYAEPANPADYDSILTMVRRHEGRASERVAEFWLRRRPDAFVAFRRAGQQLSDSQQCCCWRRLIRRNARLTRRLPRHGVSPTTVSHCDQVSACSTIVTG
jgi:rhodanese-related sulfurtransferase